MQANLKIRRYNPEVADSVRYQDYRLEIDDHYTVLDALVQIREEVDETLAVRCSCRSSICGSCAMRINGQATLACKTKVAGIAPQGETITVEPIGNMPVLKDLVVDFEVFWNKIKAIVPWLQPVGPEPEREYIVDNDTMLNLTVTMSCIMCGACVSDCTALAVDPSFLGPAALAKGLRLVADPRDGHKEDRLRQYSQRTGIWDCAHCYLCVQVCPKGVAPMETILQLRREAEAAGNTNYNGVRHSRVFAESVKETGWLDEGKIALESMGSIGEKLAMVPVGIRSLLKGKMPPTYFLHYKRPGAEHVKRIFEEVEAKE